MDQDNGQTSESDHEMEVDYLQTVLPKMRNKPTAKSKTKDNQIKTARTLLESNLSD